MERPEAANSLCCSQVLIKKYSNSAMDFGCCYGEKEGLSTASNSSKVLRLIRIHAFLNFLVNKLSPSGMNEELILTVKVDFISICFEI